MTETVFRSDAYAHSCEAYVTAVNDRGGIILDRTVLYASAGGQPGDFGALTWEGGVCRIATTVYDADKTTIVHVPAEGSDAAEMARQHAAIFLDVITGRPFAEPNPRPMFPNPPGLLRIEPHSPGLRDRIWWGAGTRATAEWTAQQGMNLMSSTLLTEDTGVPFHRLQAEQIQRFRDAWKEAGHEREPRVSVSRSIFPIVSDQDRAYFGHETHSQDQVGFLDGGNARFGKTYAGEPEQLVKELADDEAIAAADTLLLTVPNQLGVDYNAHLLDSVVRLIAPELGWR